MAYEVTGTELVYDGRISRIRLDEVTMPGGGRASREVAEHLDAVAAVPVDDSGHVVLVRQYRHPVGRYLLEIPAGLLDVDGEDPADAARRELVEETGLDAADWTPLGTFWNSAGWSDERTTVYLASRLSPAPLPPGFTPEHEESDMEVVRLPFADAVSMAAAGDITDAKTLVGLLLADHRIPSPSG